MHNKPFVSVVLPIRNEQKYINATLKTIADQDYPSNKLEVIIADGMSTDNTREMVDRFIAGCPSLKIVIIDNVNQTVSFGLNLAIKQSIGEVIVRMDAHSIYPENYITRLVECLDEHKADNTGGVVETVPANDSSSCMAIAIALSHPLGVGNSYFRIGSNKVREVDTVPFGCFRREVFDRIGFFDEELIRNQDDEFNGRMRNAGMRIILVPDVVVNYYARDSFSKLFKMYYQYGLYKPLASKKLGGIPTIRQLVPLFFVLFLFGGAFISVFSPLLFILYCAGLIFYMGIIGLVALRKSIEKGMFIVFQLVTAFFILHFSYGYGYLRGLLALATKNKSVFRNKSINR